MIEGLERVQVALPSAGTRSENSTGSQTQVTFTGLSWLPTGSHQQSLITLANSSTRTWVLPTHIKAHPDLPPELLPGSDFLDHCREASQALWRIGKPALRHK